jgi:hypothetical protein
MLSTKLKSTSDQSFCRGAFAVIHSRCRKFLKHVHNLFTPALLLSSPAGLRLEIGCESDKKKMNFIFDYNEEIFLNGKTKRACRRENKNNASKKLRATQLRRFGSPRRTGLAADSLRIQS